MGDSSFGFYRFLRPSAAMLVGALTLPAVATPGPPFITDDPEPVDYQHYEVYIASQSFRMFGNSSGTLPHLEVNYGAANNLQLHIISPMAYSTSSDQPFNYGYGDTELGAKFRFLQETKSQPMVGIFPLVEIPTGSESRGLGTGRTASYIPLWVQKSFGNWTAYGGGGYWNNPGAGNKNYWFSGATAQCQATKQLMIGGEVFHTTSQMEGFGDITGFNFGGVYDFDEGHHLMMSIGTGLQGADHGTGYLAYQWTFGPKAKEERKEK